MFCEKHNVLTENTYRNRGMYFMCLRDKVVLLTFFAFHPHLAKLLMIVLTTLKLKL
jgi:hypothetical protein